MKFKHLLLLIGLLVSCTPVRSYDKTTYYGSANGKSGASLKTALHGIIRNPSVTSYDGLIDAYRKTDTRADGCVRDWYSNTTHFHHGTDKAGSYQKEGDVYNREHSVPQSWFSKASPMKSDIVHVIPTDGYVNNRRSSFPFGEVGSVTYQSNNGYSKLGSCKTSGYSGTVFEPNDEVKGDIARIYFYMVTCYEDKATGWGHSVFSSSKYPGLESWVLSMMMRWAKQDPVDAVETARNEAVMEVQGNRNPFVDFPGLEVYVWGDEKNTPVSLTNYQNPYEGDVPTLKTPTASFPTSSVTLQKGKTLTQTLTTNSDGKPTYTSSDTRVASVNATSGMVTALQAGTTVITATVPQTANYYAASAQYVLTVTDPENPTPQPGEGGAYERVTIQPTDWSGTYLIVYEAGSLAMNGSLTTIDAANNFMEVDINQGKIQSTEETRKCEFQVVKSGQGYAFLGKNGQYMGTITSGNKLTSTADPLINTLSLSSDGVDIRSEFNTSLRYNTSGKRFRFYSPGSQQPIQLYRLVQTDGVKDVLTDVSKKGDSVIYDLTGRRLQHFSRGVNIVNGRKVVIR